MRYEGISAPSHISLSGSSILENQPVGTTVTTLSSTDPDGLDTFTCSLVSGAGSGDNGSFTITGNSLKTNPVFDYDTKSTYSIRVKTTDQTSNFFDKPFTITVDTPPTVSTTSFTESDAVNVGATTLTVTFSESVLYANVPSNYELRRAGTDGLLWNSDAVVVPTSVTVVGITAVLTFPAFAGQVYRLTVKDVITDIAGNTLDGDGNMLAGGHRRSDFVSGALTSTMTLSNGFNFDTQFGGVGAGQMVQGTRNAFDGQGRTEVGTVAYAPSTNSASSRRIYKAVPTSILAGIPAATWTTIPGMSVTFTSDGTSPAHLNATVLQYRNSSGGFAIGRFVIDGTPVTGVILGRDYQTNAGRWSSLYLDDYVNVSAGSHTVTVQVYGSDASKLGVAADNWSTLRVELADAMPTPIVVDSGRTVVGDSQSIDGLLVSREVTVPSAGAVDFSPALDSYTNPPGNLISVAVRTNGNVGSNAATTVFMSSDGDDIVEATNWWFGTDDDNAIGGTPAIIHLLHGLAGLIPTSVSVQEDNVEWTYNLTIGAGETQRLANFTVLGNTQQQAIDAANALVTPSGFGGQSAAFLTAGELASLANFQLGWNDVCESGYDYRDRCSGRCDNTRECDFGVAAGVCVCVNSDYGDW